MSARVQSDVQHQRDLGPEPPPDDASGGPVAATLLALPAFLFGVAVRAKGLAYRVGLRRAHPLGRPVVSIGNLVAGGTGKTPFVAWLAGALRRDGRRPGILSRGYGPRAAGLDLSDEGAVLRHLLGPDVPQVEDADRVRGAARLLRSHPDVDVLLLDDGFQHRRAARDVDVVLLDATRPFGGGHLLPWGRLREPPSALGRADGVVLTRVERVDRARLDRIRAEVRRWTGAPIGWARTRAVRVLEDGRTSPPESLRGRGVLALSGIGNPDAFAAFLSTDLGARVAGRIDLRDHARIDEATWARAVEAARRLGADVVVATRKDAVKSARLPAGVAVLDIGLDVEGDLAWTRAESLRPRN